MDGDRPRDPVEEAADGRIDLYDVATWEPRTALDALSIRVHAGLVRAARWLVILTAFVILLAQLVLSGLAAIANPAVGGFVILSIVPAAALAIYVWRVDVTIREPLGRLVITFLLGVLFAGFAAVLNSLARPIFGFVDVVGLALFFFLIVGPVEETVKWLAVRLYAYRTSDFGAVIDGAVYGAVAGLGFATIENTIYIGQQYLEATQAGTVASPLFQAALPTAAARTFAGPGHVIYSAFAGYYLGLAKFNPENAGAIAVKGLLIAAFIHGLYNSVVTYMGPLASLIGIAVPTTVLFLAFVVVYDGALLLLLLRKLSRYSSAYRAAGAGERSAREPLDEEESAADGGAAADPGQWGDERDEP